jgi:hypothetical protein
MDTFDAINQRRSTLTDLRSLTGSARRGGATLGPGRMRPKAGVDTKSERQYTVFR